jgi:CBS domain-containing protein
VTAFARVLSQEDVVQAVLGASSAAEAEAIVELMDVELPGSVSVGDVMSRKVRSVTLETSLAEAADSMSRYHLRSIPVVSDDGQVLGMVSSRDLLRVALPHYLRQVSGSDTRISGEGEMPEPSETGELPDPRTVAVREVMDRSVLCLTEDQTLADVASVFVNKDSDRFPVVRDGILVGLLTRGGIVRLLFGS